MPVDSTGSSTSAPLTDYSALQSNAAGTAAARTAKKTLGQQDFLKLLAVQFQTQDPMKPMDHQEFGTQLAQFSQLEQLSNIGAGINGLRTDRTDDSKLQALGMIGKKIHASGNEVTLTSGESGTIGRRSQSGWALLLMTRPLSSSSTPVAPAPTRAWADCTICWTQSSFERDRSTPSTTPWSERTGTEWKIDGALVIVEMLTPVMNGRPCIASVK